MMKKIYLFLLAISCLFSCKDDDTEQIFTGTDNYITSFIIEKEGVAYVGQISETEIKVTVPYHISLDGGKAKVTLTEHTTLTPEPADISGWESEWKFIATSYKQEDRIYTYTVEHSDIESNADIYLSTQAEVDAFKETNIRTVNGSLVIGSDSKNEPIENLQGLSNLLTIKNSLILKDSYTGSSLEGLENLQEVGSIKIGNIRTSSSSPHLKEISLNNLSKIKGELFIHAASIEIIDLPQLQSVDGSLYIKGSSLVQFNVSSLETVHGDFIVNGTIGNSSETAYEYGYFPALKTITGALEIADISSVTGFAFPVLESVKNLTFRNCNVLVDLLMNNVRQAEEVVFDSNPYLQTIVIPKVESVKNISVTNCASLEVLLFDSLTKIDGDLYLSECSLIESLAGFKSVTTMNGCLYLYKLSRIPGIAEMESLESVYDMHFTNLTNMSDVLDVSGIRLNGGTIRLVGAIGDLQIIKGASSFDGGFYFQDISGYIPRLKDIEIIEGDLIYNRATGSNATELNLLSVNTIKGDFTIANCGSVTAFDASDLAEVGGILRIQPTSLSMPMLFPSLRKVGRQLYISGWNAHQLDLSALEEVGDGSDLGSEQHLFISLVREQELSLTSLKKVNGSVFLQTAQMGNQTTIPVISIPLLEEVTGNLEVGYKTASFIYNESITYLDFNSLKRTGGTIAVYNLKGLKDFSGFKNVIANLSEEQWKISGCAYNPSFQDMKEERYIGE